MVALFFVVSVLAIVLIMPGWLWCGRKRHQTMWLLALPPLGIGLWAALAKLGVGAQSLGNIVEALVIAAVAVLMAYVKFLLLDRAGFSRSGVIAAYVVVAVVTVGLRLFMPSMPE
ncbi:hypothetical protein [Dyella acidiphila]|uniref:Uncharacterized protein n=1 Tax=Dyella acidiphila TaxID=2775866 RepID=A0ABR9G515_9GAMM|nr:hypothetical protein [Dyella acidiphila]MBE1159102.1 hypothetical protein [Dyella acidiphila]